MRGNDVMVTVTIPFCSRTGSMATIANSSDSTGSQVQKRSDMNIFYPEINIKNEVQKLMVTADQAYEHHLNEKRKRLKALLEAEEMQQQKEVMEKLREQQNEQLRAKENAMLAIQQEKERQKQEFVKNKMIQLKINNCDEIRTFIQQKYHEESKKCQLAQIEDKMRLKQTKLDEERMWKEVHLKKYQHELDRELHEKRKRKLMEDQTLLDIKVQMKEQALRSEQEKIELQEARCTSLPFPEHDNKLVQMRKCDLAENLKEQMATNLMLRKKQQEKEREVVKTLNEAMQRELKREEAAREEEKQVLKKQINQYYQYSKHVEKQRLADESKMDKLINDVRQKFENTAIEKCRTTLQKRLGFADRVYEGQRKQIAEMEERRRLEYDEKVLEGVREREFYEKHRQACIEADNRTQTAVQRYRETLNEQIKSAAIERDRRKRQDQTHTNKFAEANTRDMEFVQTYVKGSFDSHFKKHPNVSLLRKKY